MADLLQIAGAQGAPSDFAPLHINRMVTGYWTNTNPLRDAATSMFIEKFYGGRQDRIGAGVNTELSTRLTLRRRPGTSVYNSQMFPGINRFYGWNTFDTEGEAVRVMADTKNVVYDATSTPTAPNQKTAIWTKHPFAGPTFFLGVGNILYMTNGTENVQLNNATGEVTKWGIVAPTTAPVATQAGRPNPYPAWQANTVHAMWVNITPTGASTQSYLNGVVIVDPNGNCQVYYTGVDGTPVKSGQLGPTEPGWATAVNGTTPEVAPGNIVWTNLGPAARQNGYGYGVGWPISVPIANPPGTPNQLFIAVKVTGASGPAPPTAWPTAVGAQITDGGIIWQNAGPALSWSNLGSTPTQLMYITTAANIVDPSGNLQTVFQQGPSGASPPVWGTQQGALTPEPPFLDWLNTGPFAVPGTAPVIYGYAFASTDSNGDFIDISNMSPQSNALTVIQGNQVTLTGQGSADPQVSTIVLYRTAQGGSIFLYLDQIPNPPVGQQWSYIDNYTDAQLNTQIQAQVNGEGTPLPNNAGCLAYHLGRIFAAVNNVVYVSSGPDAVASGSSGNAGFDTTFTVQSKITRFWVNSLGLVVFTVRDAYIILGSGTPNDPLYIMVYIENVPLLNYDAFAVFLTTPYLLTGHGMVNALDPSSGILEASFPIADQIAAINPKTAYVTFQNGASGETALYVADGLSYWYRMAPTSAPESGLNWNTQAVITGGTSAVQSVEVLPGTFELLIGPPTGSDPFEPLEGPIMMRDPTVNTDNGTPYNAWAHLGNIVLAPSGKLAGLAWVGIESVAQGTATNLAVMLDEIQEILGSKSAYFAPVPRSRQDPPNLPPSVSVYSNRHSLLQGQKPVWCKSLQMMFYWPAEDAANELLTFTIFGQTWAEQRSQ
jgi:hypothetical protein